MSGKRPNIQVGLYSKLIQSPGKMSGEQVLREEEQKGNFNTHTHTQ